MFDHQPLSEFSQLIRTGAEICAVEKDRPRVRGSESDCIAKSKKTKRSSVGMGFAHVSFRLEKAISAAMLAQCRSSRSQATGSDQFIGGALWRR
jgi:hypothetical protein